MMGLPIEVHSGTLTVAQLEREIDRIAAYFRAEGWEQIVVSYGWGCEAEPDALYRGTPLPLASLREFIRQSRAAGTFVLGEADLRLRTTDGSLEFLLCHESDVHMTGSRAQADEVKAAWKASGFAYHEVKPHHDWYQLTPNSRIYIEM